MTVLDLVETPVVVPTSVLDDAGSANPSLALPAADVPVRDGAKPLCLVIPAPLTGATSPDDGFDRSREYFGAFLPAKPDAPLPFTRPPIDAPTLADVVKAWCE